MKSWLALDSLLLWLPQTLYSSASTSRVLGLYNTCTFSSSILIPPIRIIVAKNPSVPLKDCRQTCSSPGLLREAVLLDLTHNALCDLKISPSGVTFPNAQLPLCPVLVSSVSLKHSLSTSFLYTRQGQVQIRWDPVLSSPQLHCCPWMSQE